jgi:small subunit ribosomal protein S1
VHISELANHHVENPREVVQPGDEVRVKILEIDSERRRLSLSVKRVEGQELPIRSLEGDAGDLDDMPELELSEDVFVEGSTTPEVEAETAEAPEAETAEAPEADTAEAPEAEAEIPEGVDDQVEREAEASPGDEETPGSTANA